MEQQYTQEKIQKIGRFLRRQIVQMTTAAGSGHVTSSLSAVELMSVLFFGRDQAAQPFFVYDCAQPEQYTNDRIIFSKGHASPLFYALWAASGAISVDALRAYRQAESVLEGHPTRRFPFTEVPTGSLGQGMSVAIGEALALRACGSTARVFVLLGDSELAEGQVWEAAACAAHNGCAHVTAIVDVNRLGQRGETMTAWDIDTIAARFRAWGWHAISVPDGHNETLLADAYATVRTIVDRPTVIVARTVKGKGVSFLENADGWHGVALSQEQARQALEEIGGDDSAWRAVSLAHPISAAISVTEKSAEEKMPSYDSGASVAPRDAYGDALAALARADCRIVVLDAETSNSTRADRVHAAVPAQFYEMYIAEQNMVSVAVGMSRRGLRPFVSTFAAFLTRAADQIRMAQYANVPLVLCGSHSGVSIGADGASQMGLEDLALISALRNSTIFVASDATSMTAIVRLATTCTGVTYIRSLRDAVPVLYPPTTQFIVGGSHVVRQSAQDHVTIIAAGITVHEACVAADHLAAQGIAMRVIDCYSVRPLDFATVRRAAEETGCVLIVEDHYENGGLGAAVRVALDGIAVRITHLCVRIMPHSATGMQLRAEAGIDADAIVRTVYSCMSHTE